MSTQDAEINALMTLVIEGDIEVAPYKTQRVGVHYEVIVGIGKDHVATVTLDEDAYFELCKMAKDK